MDFETEFRQPFFVIARRVKKIRHRHLAEKFAPAFQPHFRPQREENVMRVAFAAAGNDQPSAGFQNRRRAAQNFLVVVHPMQRGVGKNQVELASSNLIFRASMT